MPEEGAGEQWEWGMSALLREARGSFAPLRQKLQHLGVHQETDLNAIMSKISVGRHFDRGEDIVPAGSSPKHSTVLINGVACLYERLVDGRRQIYTFQYPGDFCDLSRHVLQATTSDVAVGAATDCWTGSIENHALDRLLVQYPAFGTALWRLSVLEASALRVRLLNHRKTAIQNVAHLLCEHLARQSAIGVTNSIIPVYQVELADAAGLSTVHINRTVKELQRLGLLAKSGRSIHVVDRQRLAHLAGFDGHYLDMPKVLKSWEVTLLKLCSSL
jgi:CRP-like cAMP-binding protein